MGRRNKSRNGGKVYSAIKNIGVQFDNSIIADVQWKRMTHKLIYDNRGEQTVARSEFNIDYVTHIKDFLIKNTTTLKTSGRTDVPSVVVGCDSQVHGKDNVYVIVIGLRYIGNLGTHLIKSKFTLEGDITIKQRLMIETLATLEVATQLEKMLVWDGWMNDNNVMKLVWNDNYERFELPIVYKNGKSLDYTNFIETAIDLNRDELHKSNAVLKESINRMKSMGFKVDAKPNADIASCGADKYN